MTIESLLCTAFSWRTLPATDGPEWNGAYATFITADQAIPFFDYGRANGARIVSSSITRGGLENIDWANPNYRPYADSLLGKDGIMFAIPGGAGFYLEPVSEWAYYAPQLIGKGWGYKLTYCRGAAAWNLAQSQMVAANQKDTMGNLVLAGIVAVAGGALFAPDTLAGITGYSGASASAAIPEGFYLNEVTGQVLPYGEVGSIGTPGFMTAETVVPGAVSQLTGTAGTASTLTTVKGAADAIITAGKVVGTVVGVSQAVGGKKTPYSGVVNPNGAGTVPQNRPDQTAQNGAGFNPLYILIAAIAAVKLF